MTKVLLLCSFSLVSCLCLADENGGSETGERPDVVGMAQDMASAMQDASDSIPADAADMAALMAMLVSASAAESPEAVDAELAQSKTE